MEIKYQSKQMIFNKLLIIHFLVMILIKIKFIIKLLNHLIYIQKRLLEKLLKIH